MKKNHFNESFNCMFDVYGEHMCKDFTCMFDIEENNECIIETIGEEQYVNNGILYDLVNDKKIPKSNVIINIYKDKYLYDRSISDENGKYYIFIKPGIYDVKIISGNDIIEYKNQLFENGISKNYYKKINGLITKKYNDIIKFNLDNIYGVDGCIINNRGKKEPVEIIISKDNKLYTYYYSKDGTYNFAIEKGIYDIRLRAENQDIQIFRNFEFNGESFIGELNNQTNIFNKDNVRG